jgi:hypothetical protein
VGPAAQAYYRQSRDVENEIGASRVRVRAERRLGEILKQMAETGERRTSGQHKELSHGEKASAGLADLGIEENRAYRAIALASVPEEEFEAAMTGEEVAQPTRIVRKNKQGKGNKNGKDITPKPLVPITQTLDLWGGVRNFGQRLADQHPHMVPPGVHERANLGLEEHARPDWPDVANLLAVDEHPVQLCLVADRLDGAQKELPIVRREDEGILNGVDHRPPPRRRIWAAMALV